MTPGRGDVCSIPHRSTFTYIYSIYRYYIRMLYYLLPMILIKLKIIEYYRALVFDLLARKYGGNIQVS